MSLLLAVKRGDEFLGLVADFDQPAKGVLMGGSVTPAVFRNRTAAQAAVRRTKEYANKIGVDWGPIRIVRLVEHGVVEVTR